MPDSNQVKMKTVEYDKTIQDIARLTKPFHHQVAFVNHMLFTRKDAEDKKRALRKARFFGYKTTKVLELMRFLSSDKAPTWQPDA